MVIYPEVCDEERNTRGIYIIWHSEINAHMWSEIGNWIFL